MTLFIVLVLASAASNTEGALSLVLWSAAAASLAGAIYLRTPSGRAAYARRATKGSGAASEPSDKQRLTKPKPPKLLPIRRANKDQKIAQESKANLKPKNRTRDR